MASRMESHGEPERIQITSNTKTLLELTEAVGYTIKSRGTIEVKVMWNYCMAVILEKISKGFLTYAKHVSSYRDFFLIKSEDVFLNERSI